MKDNKEILLGIRDKEGCPLAEDEDILSLSDMPHYAD